MADAEHLDHLAPDASQTGVGWGRGVFSHLAVSVCGMDSLEPLLSEFCELQTPDGKFKLRRLVSICFLLGCRERRGTNS